MAAPAGGLATAGVDAATLRVVGEVVRLVRERGDDVPVALAAFAVRTVALGEGEGPPAYALDSDLAPDAAEELAAKAAERALRANDPALEMIKMQIALDAEFALRSQEVDNSQKAHVAEYQDLTEAILSATVLAESDAASLASLQRHVFAYVCARTNMHEALREPQYEAEVTAALESVFPAHGLARFATLEGDSKRAQLGELALIVLGIRVFNRSVGKGGDDLGDVRAQYRAAATGARARASELASDARGEAARYRSVLEHASTRAPPGAPPMCRLRDEYHNRAQFAAFAKALATDIADGVRTFGKLEAEADAELASLRELIDGRASVPKSSVYPHFETLGALHLAMADEAASLGVHGAVLETLAPFAADSGFDTVVSFKDFREARDAHPGAPIEDKGVSAVWGVPPAPGPGVDALALAEASGAKRATPEDTPVEDYAAIEPEFAGHCPVSVVSRAGLAIPGDARLGYVEFDGKYYACASEAAAVTFSCDPKAYVTAVHRVARTMPELIRLLQLQAEPPAELLGSTASSSMGTLGGGELLTCDFGTQTPTHIVEKNIDANYEWNEWALRRRVLRLANLRQKRTHSTQSNLSHFRRETDTQVWLPKTSVTQTGIAKGTTMPRKGRYLAGLRGAPDTIMKVVNVGFDIGQPHQY